MSDDATAEMGHQQLFDHLMATKYWPTIAQILQKESERRMDAFADGVTFTVCGEEIRMMTPRDLVLLDGFENAFACMTEPALADLQWVLWTLSAANNGTRSWANRYRKGRLYQRLRMRGDFAADSSEVYQYMDRLWLDSPCDDNVVDMPGAYIPPRKPAGVYELAALMANVAGAIGAVDPMTGALLGDTPIPRLLQYQRSACERKTGEQDATSFDSARSRCLEETNNIIAARRIS